MIRNYKITEYIENTISECKIYLQEFPLIINRPGVRRSWLIETLKNYVTKIENILEYNESSNYHTEIIQVLMQISKVIKQISKSEFKSDRRE